MYLGMGPKRSLRKLMKRLQRDHEVSTCLRTLGRWCVDGRWVQAATEHDAKVAALSQVALEKQAVEQTVDLVQRATDAAERAIQWLEDALANTKPENVTDIAIMIDRVIEMLKAVEVMRGGVSDRTAHGSMSVDIGEMLGSFRPPNKEPAY